MLVAITTFLSALPLGLLDLLVGAIEALLGGS